MSVNKVILVGALGADPEIKVGERTLTKMSVATNESWTDKEGVKQEKTEWHKVTAWGKLGDLCGQYLKKGRQVYVEGKIQTRSWDDDAGVKKYITEVVADTVKFLGKSDKENTNEQSF